MGFGYYRSVTINPAQLPSTLTDFAFPVSITDPTLKSVANGGHVQNNFCYDIQPFFDTGLTTALFYNLEFYDPVAGTVDLWIALPSASNGSVAYLAYGDASIVSDGSSPSTWDSGFKTVWHLPNGTA